MRNPEDLSVTEIMRRQEYIHVLADEYDAFRCKEAIFGELTEAEQTEFNWVVNTIIAEGEALYREGLPPESPH